MSYKQCLSFLSLCLFLQGIYFVRGGFMYVGSESTSLYLCSFNEAQGDVKLISTITAQYPSFLAVHPSKEYLYTTNEVSDFNNINNSGGISAYKVDKDNGHLTLINSVPSYGALPAHIALDTTGRWIGVANYGSGNYGAWRVEDNFAIATKATSFEQDKGHGPLPRQAGPHAHEFVFGRFNTFVVVPDLGTDRWNQYFFDDKTGELAFISAIVAPPGSGPRHFAFHPFLPYAYGVSEIESTVTVFSAPEHLKSLSVIQNISTLPQPDPSAAAGELQLSPDGKYLYTSNRFYTSNGTIAIFSIDQSSGKLTSAGYFGTIGILPRFFTLSQDGRFILVANQFSNNIQVFERDAQTGHAVRHVSSLEGLAQASHILLL